MLPISINFLSSKETKNESFAVPEVTAPNEKVVGAVLGSAPV